MRPKVYLAGGFRSNWQKKVIDACDNAFIFFNPSEHGLEINPNHYTTWDLFHVKECNILFVYMEKTNPSGYGLSLEIGYAKALGKTIILVDEKSSTNQSFERYFKIVQVSSNVVFCSLNEGIKFLQSFS